MTPTESPREIRYRTRSAITRPSHIEDSDSLPSGRRSQASNPRASGNASLGRNELPGTSQTHSNIQSQEVGDSDGPESLEDSIENRNGDIRKMLRALEHRVEHKIRATNEKIEKNVTWAVDMVKDMSEKLGESVVSRITQINNEAQMELDDAMEQNKAAEKEILRLNQQLDKVQGKLEKAQRRIAEGGPLANSTKTTDKDIVGKWKQLEYNIRCLARCMGALNNYNVSDPVISRLRAVTEHWHLYMGNEDLRDHLCQGYLWYLVKWTIFDTSVGGWAGNKNLSFKIIKENLIGQQKLQNNQQSTANAPSMQSITRWSSQGSALIDHFMHHDLTSLDQLITMETGFLELWFKNNPTQPWTELKAIFECALEIDQMLTSSRALFSTHLNVGCEINEGKLQLDPDAMEAVAYNTPLSEQSCVQFFVSPILYKVGNADGENYDKGFVLIKALVVCD